MKRYVLFLIAIVMAITILACGLSINLPIDTIRTGETRTEDITVPVPDETPAEVKIEFGAGELSINPGTDSSLIAGEAQYNVQDFKPEVSVEGGEVVVSTGNLKIDGIPNIRFDDIVNTWDLSLNTTPMDLTVNAGGYKGKFDLGGLTIQSLEISDGAAEVDLDFSAPNLTEMRRFRYSTGASSVDMHHLGNANFSLMTFRSGAGEYTLDFSGDLKQDASVIIESGISQITIIIPEGTPASVTFRGGLTDVDLSGDWQVSGNYYQVEGDGPKLNIEVEMGAGSLQLRVR